MSGPNSTPPSADDTPGTPDFQDVSTDTSDALDAPEVSTDPYIVLRCGGKGGQCSKPVFIPFGKLGNITEIRTLLQSVGWAALDRKAGGFNLIDIACPECLLLYITGQLQQQAGELSPQAKAALTTLGAKSTADGEAPTPAPTPASTPAPAAPDASLSDDSDVQPEA